MKCAIRARTIRSATISTRHRVQFRLSGVFPEFSPVGQHAIRPSRQNSEAGTRGVGRSYISAFDVNSTAGWHPVAEQRSIRQQPAGSWPRIQPAERRGSRVRLGCIRRRSNRRWNAGHRNRGAGRVLPQAGRRIRRVLCRPGAPTRPGGTARLACGAGAWPAHPGTRRGHGYWTAVAAPVAATITATDINAETLAIAGGRGLGAHVCLVPADVWNLPDLADGSISAWHISGGRICGNRSVARSWDG